MSLFPEVPKGKVIMHGVVQVIGARKVQVLVDKKTVIAKCDPQILNTISIGSTVVLAYLGGDQTSAYVMTVATDPFDQNDQGVFTI